MTFSVAQALQTFQPDLPLAVALSGGADSTALLHACAKRWPGQVRAVHIHHGLQSAADAFAAHCQTLCAQRAVPLVVVRVKAQHAPGQSPEDAARVARYTALTQAVMHDPQLSGVRDLARPSMPMTRSRPCCWLCRVAPVCPAWPACPRRGSETACAGTGLGCGWRGLNCALG